MCLCDHLLFDLVIGLEVPLLILEVGNTSQSLAELGLHILQPSLEIPGGALPTPRCTPPLETGLFSLVNPGPTELFSRFNLFSLSVLEFSALAVVVRRSIPGHTLETVERFNARRVVVVIVLRRPPLVVDLSARLMVDMLFALVRLDSPILGSGGPIFCFLSATPVSSSIDLGRGLLGECAWCDQPARL